MSLYFVGGIHGVGKSTLCDKLSVPLDAIHLKASELIHYKPSPADPTRKAVLDVEANQRQLVEALKSFPRSGANILLDGHFCLADTNGSIARVPLETFRALRPTALLVVEAEPAMILERLLRRSGSAFSLDLIVGLTTAERTYAEQVSNELAVPLKIWESGTPIDTLIEFFLVSSPTR
jgi:adenylate kinase